MRCRGAPSACLSTQVPDFHGCASAEEVGGWRGRASLVSGAWEDAVAKARELHKAGEYEAGLKSILSALDLDEHGEAHQPANAALLCPGGGSSIGSSRLGKPSSAAPLHEDMLRLREYCKQQLALLGAQCCNRLGERCLGVKDWQKGLAYATTALRLVEGARTSAEGSGDGDRWRSFEPWACCRFRALRCAAEAQKYAGDSRASLEESRSLLLQCVEVLDAWPKSDWHGEDVAIFTYLAEVQKKLENLAGARHSCLRALASSSASASTSRIYATVVVLWMLQKIALEEHCWTEAEAVLQCATHVAKPVTKTPTGSSSGDGFGKPLDSLLRGMRRVQRQKVPPRHQQKQLQLQCPERPDLRWLLRFESDQDAKAVASVGVAPPHAAQACGAGAGATASPPEVGAAVARANAADVALAGRRPAPAAALGRPAKRVSTTEAAHGKADAAPSRTTQETDTFVLVVSSVVPGRNFPSATFCMGATQKLSKVVSMWMSKFLGRKDVPEGVSAFAGSGGQPLDLEATVQQVVPLLPLRDNKHRSVALSLPAQVAQKSNQPTSAGAAAVSASAVSAVSVSQGKSSNANVKNKLYRMAISTRYSCVKRGANAGFHRSSTYGGKLASGEYKKTFGEYSQAAYIEAMRTPPAPQADITSEPIEELELSVQEQDQQLFLATLRGPGSLLANWVATCEAFKKGRWGKDGKDLPFPVLIPSRGRVLKALLNWEAEHVYGHLLRDDGSNTLRPVVCVVLEQEEETHYRQVWPSILALVLPKSGRGAGYARWVIQRVCTRSSYIMKKAAGRQLCRFPYVWVVDDSLSMFYHLAALETPGEPVSDRTGAPRRLTRREAPKGTLMFRDAFLAVQQHHFMSQAAVGGFLRDDGTAVCKKLEWKSDELSLYKVVLLNLRELERLEVQYQPNLKMYEDILLTHQVTMAGGHTLKCQSYCFRASHFGNGGCTGEQTRGHGGSGTRLEDLIAPAVLQKLSLKQQTAIAELFKWVKTKERWSQEKESAQNLLPGSLTKKRMPSKEKVEKVRGRRQKARRVAKEKEIAERPDDEEGVGESSSSSSESSPSSTPDSLSLIDLLWWYP